MTLDFHKEYARKTVTIVDRGPPVQVHPLHSYKVFASSDDGSVKTLCNNKDNQQKIANFAHHMHNEILIRNNLLEDNDNTNLKLSEKVNLKERVIQGSFELVDNTVNDQTYLKFDSINNKKIIILSCEGVKTAFKTVDDNSIEVIDYTADLELSGHDILRSDEL